MQEIPQNIRKELKAAKDLLESGGSEAAEKAREKLLDLSDANGYPIYHLLLAKAAKELKQRETALAHLEKSLEFDKKNAQAVIRVAEHKIEMGDNVGGTELLNEAVNIVDETGDSKIGCKVAALLIKTNRTDEAIRLLKDLKTAYPNDPEVAYTLGLAYRESGNEDAHISESLAAIQRSSLNKSIKQRVSLSKYFISHCDYEKALDLLTPLRVLNETDYPTDQSKAIINTLLAISYVELKEIDDARVHIIEVNNQTNIGSNYVWAKIQLSEDELEAAYSSAVAIQGLAHKNLEQHAARRKKALEILETPVTQEIKKKGERIAKSSAKGFELLSDLKISKDIESINKFLTEAKKILLASVPG